MREERERKIVYERRLKKEIKEYMKSEL